MPGRCERAALPVLPAPEGSPGSWTGTQTSQFPAGTKVKSQGFHPSPGCAAGSALGSGTASSSVRARWKFAWLNSVPDPSWNLGAGKPGSSCCSRNIQGVRGNLLPEPGSMGGRKGMQSHHKKKSRVSALGARTSFVPGNQPPARLGMQEEPGNEEWEKALGAGQWGLGAPHRPHQSHLLKVLHQRRLSGFLPHCRTFLGGFPWKGGVTPQTRHGSFS